jgi:hypothetical protein
MDPILALAAKLDRVIERGSGRYDALCPVPVDHSPSLTIRTADDGRAWVHGGAGCSVESILRALGLGWEALFHDARTRDHRIAIACRLGKPAEPDPLEVEPWGLRIAAADVRAGKNLSAEDRACVQVRRRTAHLDRLALRASRSMALRSTTTPISASTR